MKQREIPKEFYSKLYLVPKFYSYCNTLLPNKFPKVKNDHPRLLIPFFDEDDNMFAFQGRSFGKEEPKYFTICLNDNRKIYGLDKVNWNKTVYVVEGPIDSLFIDNCIATANSDLRIEERLSLIHI